ncbi:MAG: ATP synthase F0 subunit C [Gammaproteobacteria bacterium]|nr:ATP synthase F0 subunit C [Gammaproteobacteria bacterium]
MLENLLVSFISVLAEATEFNQYFSKGMAYLGAGIAVLTGISQGIGQSLVAAKAVESIARQPEAASKITSTMIVGSSIAETTGLYALITAMILIFATN